MAGLGAQSPTPVHLQDQVTGRWVNVSSYPMVDRYTPFLLGPGTLRSASSAVGQDSIPWGSPSASTFTTTPFVGGTTVAGPVSARLWASSTTRNLQLFLELDDIAPDGTSRAVTHGSLLGSLAQLDPSKTWRDQGGLVTRPYPYLRADSSLTPGTMQSFDVSLSPVLYTVAAGHSLRLSIRSRPAADACAAVDALPLGVVLGRPVGCLLTPQQTNTLTGSTVTIDRTAAHPSSLNLPLIATAKLATVASGVTPTGGSVLPQDWGAPVAVPATGTTNKGANPRRTTPAGAQITDAGGSLAATGLPLLGPVMGALALGLGVSLARRRRMADARP